MRNYSYGGLIFTLSFFHGVCDWRGFVHVFLKNKNMEKAMCLTNIKNTQHNNYTIHKTHTHTHTHTTNPCKYTKIYSL